MANEITDLTGYTWKANDTITLDMLTTTYNLNFTCNGVDYTQLKTENVIDDMIYNRLLYGDTEVYNDLDNVWADEKYKTIKITGGTDATNFWLIENLLSQNGTLTKESSETFKLGSLVVEDLKLGTEQVSELYLGENLIWSK